MDFKTISDFHIKAEIQMGKKFLRADDQRTVDDCQNKGESHIDVTVSRLCTRAKFS